MSEPTIVQNALRVKSVDKIYWSRHRHDFIRFETADGDCILDGGTEYIRTSVGPDNTDVEWLTISENDSVEDAATRLVGIKDDGEYVLASTLSESELLAMKERLAAGKGHPLLLAATDHFLAALNPVLDRILDN